MGCRSPRQTPQEDRSGAAGASPLPVFISVAGVPALRLPGSVGPADPEPPSRSRGVRAKAPWLTVSDSLPDFRPLGKSGNFRRRASWQRLDAVWSVSIVDEVAVRRAPDTAWTVYRAAHPDVDAQDGRRCLFEHSFGLAYLHRIPRDEC